MKLLPLSLPKLACMCERARAHTHTHTHTHTAPLLLPGPQLTDSLLALRSGAGIGPGTKGTKEQGRADGTGSQDSASYTVGPARPVFTAKPADGCVSTPIPPASTAEVPLPSPDPHLRRHLFNPLAPYLLHPQPGSWRLDNSLFCLENTPFQASYPPALAFPSQPNLSTRGVCTCISHSLTSHLPQSGFGPSRPQGLASRSP